LDLALRAIVVERHGTPAEMVIREQPVPETRPGHVLVEIHAIGLNYPDLLVIAGTYQILPPLPFIAGKEAAGIVRGLGPGVSRLKTGDRVSVLVENGAYTEALVVPESLCYPIPDSVDFVTAAAMGLAYQTAYFGLVEHAHLKPGDTVLVTGAAGGVGVAAVQLAEALGGTALAGIGTPSKAEFVRLNGARAVIDLSADDLRDSVRRQVYAATGGCGANIVFDPVGGEVFEASLRALAWSGRIVVVGFTSGQFPTVKANYLLIKNITATGLHWSDYRDREPERVARVHAILNSLLVAGKINPPMMAVYQFERFAEGLAMIAERRALGKIVLITEIGAKER
jgi:NADPH2:quinone reductase